MPEICMPIIVHLNITTCSQGRFCFNMLVDHISFIFFNLKIYVKLFYNNKKHTNYVKYKLFIKYYFLFYIEI